MSRISGSGVQTEYFWPLWTVVGQSIAKKLGFLWFTHIPETENPLCLMEQTAELCVGNGLTVIRSRPYLAAIVGWSVTIIDAILTTQGVIVIIHRHENMICLSSSVIAFNQTASGLPHPELSEYLSIIITYLYLDASGFGGLATTASRGVLCPQLYFVV